MFVILTFPALAEPTDNPADVSSDTASTTSSLTKEDLVVEDKSTVDDSIQQIVDVNEGMLNDLTKGVKDLSADFQKYFLTKSIGKSLFNFFFPLGLFVMFMSWSIGLGKKAVDGTLYDGAEGTKGAFASALIALFAGIIVLSISKGVLQLVDGIMEEIASKISIKNLNGLQSINAMLAKEQMTYEESSAPIIGWLINLWNSIAANWVRGMGSLCTLICYIAIWIMLASRIIKLTIYQGISPLFFGLSTSDETKQYFKNFVMNYTLLSAQVVIISVLVTAFNTALVYAPNLIKLSSKAANLGFVFSGMLVSILFTILICKSSKFLQDLVR